MAAATAGSGMKWVGRAIRRLEDPALVTGRGRFTADLNADLWVRFVRSPVASGRIVGITAPDGARIYRAADLDGVRPIRPMLHKFNYQPIEQPILATDVVRFVGEPIAAVVASIARRGRGHRRSGGGRDRGIAGGRRRARGAKARRAAASMTIALECRGRRPLQDRGFRRDDRAGRTRSSASTSARAGRMRRRSKRARRMRRSIRHRAA